MTNLNFLIAEIRAFTVKFFSGVTKPLGFAKGQMISEYFFSPMKKFDK